MNTPEKLVNSWEMLVSTDLWVSMKETLENKLGWKEHTLLENRAVMWENSLVM